MKLYELPGCPYCQMVKEVLAELDLKYESVIVPADRAKRTEVIAVSGQPYVPVLVDGDRVFDDENEIIQHLRKKRADR